MEKLYKSYTSSAVFSKYDEETFSNWGSLYFHHRILPQMHKNKDAAILELGCGYGRYLRVLQKLGYSDTSGIDISEEQISYAQEKLQLKNVTHGDALEFMKNTEKKYDIILMLDVMEHLSCEYGLDLATEIFRCLKPGGRLIVQVPNAMCPLQPILYGDVTHKQAYTSMSMKQLLISAGFTDIKASSLPTVVHGLKSFVRRGIWNVVFMPFIKLYLITTCGDLMGNIYTPNFLTIATKKQECTCLS